MPLIKGAKAKTRKEFSKNVEAEMHANKPQKQAVAIAYSLAREAKKGSRPEGAKVSKPKLRKK